MPVINSTLDLGTTITNDLSSCMHIRDIAAKAHMRANAIHRSFLLKDKHFLLRAHLVLCQTSVRTQFCRVVSIFEAIVLIKKVQRRFTKRLRGLERTSYSELIV